MLRKLMFIDTESLEDYHLSISDKADVNNIEKNLMNYINI